MVFGRSFNPYARFLEFSDFDESDDGFVFFCLSPKEEAQKRNVRRLKHLRQKKNQQKACDSEAFTYNIDVQEFTADEVTVKVNDENKIIVEAKHDDKTDEHGTIARQFVRKLNVPDGYDLEKIQSKMSSDGVLTLTVPKCIVVENPKERDIPIVITGKPAKSIEESKTGDDKKAMDIEP